MTLHKLMNFIRPIGCTLPMIILAGCADAGNRSSSSSVWQSRRRGIFIAEYSIPKVAQLGRYEPREVWVESVPDRDQKIIVVRLRGPHVDSEPRVQIVGLDQWDYRAIWSERNGPPYEVWTAPDPLPSTLILTNDSVTVTLTKQ